MEVKLREKSTNWKRTQLVNLAKNEKSSFVIGPFGSDLVQSDYRSSGVPVVFVRDIKRNKFKWKSNVYLTEDKAAQLHAHSVLPGDIIVTKMGLPPGIAALYPYDMETGIVTADILRLRPNTDKVDPTFLCNYLNSYHITKQVHQRTAGQTRPKLTLADYKTIKINLPPLLEQKKIARILSTWDKSIETVEKLIENSKAQKKALMQQLLTGKRRLPGFDGKWKTVRLGDIGDISSAGVDKKINKGEEPVRLLNYLDVLNRDFISDEQLSHWVTAPDRKIHNCNILKGDVFFTPSSETRDDIAHSAVATETIPKAAYSYHIIRFRLHENWDLIFRTYAFKTPYFYKQAYSLCEGSGQRYVISQRYFRNMTVHIPLDIEEQYKIASILSTNDKEIETLQQKLDCLKQEKKALMQQLLTGKRRVQIN